SQICSLACLTVIRYRFNRELFNADDGDTFSIYFAKFNFGNDTRLCALRNLMSEYTMID
ncbi:hypothetical protein HKBW3S03_01729, partial [Candidatus Hakubella thermalkaliphila]